MNCMAINYFSHAACKINPHKHPFIIWHPEEETGEEEEEDEENGRGQTVVFFYFSDSHSNDDPCCIMCQSISMFPTRITITSPLWVSPSLPERTTNTLHFEFAHSFWVCSGEKHSNHSYWYHNPQSNGYLRGPLKAIKPNRGRRALGHG